MEITITNEQKVTVTLTPTTATGRPAKLDGPPKWEVQSGNSTVTPSEDGLSAVLTSADEPGLTTVLLTADVDLGEGVTTIQDSISLQVTGALASNLGLTVGQPEPK